MGEESKIDRINRMRAAVEKAIAGDFSGPVEKSGQNDEIDRLADSVNQLLGIVKEKSGVKTKAENAILLKKSEQRLSNIISASPIGISMFDASGQCVMANDSLAEMVGGTRQQLLTQNYNDLSSWRDSGLLDVARMVLKTKTSKRHEVVSTSSFGKKMFLDGHLVPFGENGLLYMCQDITERKRAEKALLESEGRLKSVFRAVPAGIGVAVGRVFKQVNRRMFEITGYSEDELLNHNARMLYISDEEYERAGRLYAQAYKQKIVSLETRWRRKDGRVIDILLKFTLTPVEDLRKEVTFSALDITDRKQAENALRFTQFAIDKITDIAFWMTEDGRFIYVNDAACRKLGYSREELLTMSIPDIDPTFPPEMFAEHWHELRGSGSIALEGVHRTKDGREYPVDVRANHVVFDGKEYNCAFATDISERKRIENNLILAHKRFSKVLNSLKSIVYVADMETYEILFLNESGRRSIGDVVGKTCWQVLQKNQTGPCEFCTNDRLVDSRGKSTGLYEWEHHNEITNCWYHIQDQAIEWFDSRLV